MKRRPGMGMQLQGKALHRAKYNDCYRPERCPPHISPRKSYRDHNSNSADCALQVEALTEITGLHRSQKGVVWSLIRSMPRKIFELPLPTRAILTSNEVSEAAELCAVASQATWHDRQGGVSRFHRTNG